MDKDKLIKKARTLSDDELQEEIVKRVRFMALDIFNTPGRTVALCFVKAFEKLYAMINIHFDYQMEKDFGSGEKVIENYSREELEMAYVAGVIVGEMYRERRMEYA